VTESTGESGSVQRGESTQSARPAPAGGGDLTKMLENRVKQLDAMSDIDLHNRYGLSRKDLADLEKYRTAAAPYEDMIVGAREVFSATGLHVDRNGKVSRNGKDLRGVGVWDQLWKDTEFSNAPNADVALGYFKAKLRNQLTGAAASPEEDARIAALVDAITEANFTEKVGALYSYFNNRINAIAAPQVVRDAYSKMQNEATATAPRGATPITKKVPLADDRGPLLEDPEQTRGRSF
jgi:hypothetical protein